MEKFEDHIRPDLPSKCTWSANTKLASPHCPFKNSTSNDDIKPDILHVIGNTPMVRLNRIPQSAGIKCEMCLQLSDSSKAPYHFGSSDFLKYPHFDQSFHPAILEMKILLSQMESMAKCEYMNPGGSVKDRIAWRMVEEAERKGLLKPGGTIIEASSGNTAIGLALTAAIKGYGCVIVIPMRMSEEKIRTLEVLGARVIRIPLDIPVDATGGLFDVTQRLNHEIPNSVVVNQFKNADNPLAHYYGTGAEIVKQCNGKLDMVVIGTGTGGTITGIGRYIKDHCPNAKVVGVDPYGSVLAEPPELNITDKGFTVEGIGYVFIPTTLDRSVVDKWVKTSDDETFIMARRLIREEGLLCGGSSGAIMVGALKAAAELKEGQRCVVLLPDSIRNYMTRLVDENWMKQNGYYR